MPKNERVLITGASSGIGYALAQVFAENGYDLVLVARSQEKLQKLKEEIQHKYSRDALVIAKDLSKEKAAEELYAELKDCTVDILVNNAGFGDFGFFSETSWTKEKEMLELNIVTLTALTKFFLGPMKQRGRGKILNLASTAAFQPGPLMAVYFASKAYVLHFSEALANELEGSGVTVTALCPGPTTSNFQTVAAMEDSGLFKRKIPSSREVAEYGFQALMKAQTVAVHGLRNKITAFSTRLVPRNWVTRLVRLMQG